MQLTIIRNDVRYPAYYPVSYGPQHVSTREELREVLADNIRTDRGTAHISITVLSDEGSLLYSGSVEGLKGKRLIVR